MHIEPLLKIALSPPLSNTQSLTVNSPLLTMAFEVQFLKLIPSISTSLLLLLIAQFITSMFAPIILTLFVNVIF